MKNEDIDAPHALPEYVLLAQWYDDTLSVICHYHHLPSAENIYYMIDDFIDMCDGREPAAIILTRKFVSKLQPRHSKTEKAK